MAVVILCSCVGGPLRELAFQGTLPSSVVVSHATAKSFGAELAASLPLRLEGETAPVLSGGKERGGMIGLISTKERDTRVAVFANPDFRAINVTIYGNIESAAAQSLATGVQDVFARVYPNQKIERVIRKQTLLGP